MHDDSLDLLEIIRLQVVDVLELSDEQFADNNQDERLNLISIAFLINFFFFLF
jgi:hypothetical protein